MAVEPMTTELKSLLQANTVHADIIKYLEETEGCLTIKSFANIVDTKPELNAAVFVHVTSITTKKAVELSYLKQAWREAEGMVARGLKKTSEGIEEESLDEPLQVDVQKKIEKEFTRHYGKWTIKPIKMGCDTLLGRVRREFDKGRVTIFPLNRVRSLAHVSKDLPQKRQRIGDQLVVEFVQNQDTEMYTDVRDTNKVFMLISQLNILSTTWAVAGCFDTAEKDKDGSFLKYAHWQDCSEYVGEIERRAIKMLPWCKEQSVASFVVDVDAHLRAAAIDLIRSEEVSSFGTALKMAVKEQYHVFKEFEDAVEPRQTANLANAVWNGQRLKARQQNQGQGNKSQKGDDKGSRKGAGKGGKAPKGGKDKNKKGICSNFNQGRCNSPNCNKLHMCSNKKKNGTFCNSTAHGKVNCPLKD
jgi:hypothetical protein